MNNNLPAFKPNFKYSNIGIAVGKLVYAQPLAKKETNEQYGHEFLVFAQGQGSINVRIPKLETSQSSLDAYPVDGKPRIKVGLTKISQFVTDQGKVYTNLTSFVPFDEPVKVDGTEMTDSIKGRVGGEVAAIRQTQENNIVITLVSYQTDKDDSTKLATLPNGKTIDPEVLQVVVEDDAVKQDIVSKNVGVGSNIEIGYAYINRDDIEYDEYGFPIGSGNRIEKLVAGRVIVHSSGEQNNTGGFGNVSQNTQQMGFNQNQKPQNNQQNGFNNQNSNNNQNNGFGSQQQDSQLGQPLNDNNPLAQQANNIFNQNNSGGFQFGQ